MKSCKIFLIWLLIFIAASFIGCKQKKDKSTQSDANLVEPNIPKTVSAGTENQPAVASKVLATVNGVNITEQQIEQQFEKEASSVDKQMPPQFFGQYKDAMQKKLLEKMVLGVILDQKAKENNITVTDDEVTAHIEKIASGYKMPIEEYKAMLKAQGRDFSEYKENLRRQLGHEKFLQSQLNASVTVTEEEMKKYYSENTEKFKRDGQIASFDDARSEVNLILLKDKRKQVLSQYVEKLKAEANIIYMN